MSNSTLKTLFVVASAVGIAAASTHALATCGRSSSEPVQVGATSSDPEKGTIGFVCSSEEPERTASIPNAALGPVVAVGTVSGDPERDTYGYGGRGAQ
jgi:hypothetical protein